MKLHHLISTILCFVASGQLFAHAQDMDSAIAKLTEDVSARISDSSSKKVTVLDFTDLQGNATELGRYIAEQLTVDFVMSKRSFSVLDRANLKRILAEHKLTATGLVDPATAKQFGQLAGVDAMLFGTIVPIGDSIKVAVKIIKTDTAEIVGGGRTEFKSDAAVQKLLANPTKVDASADANQNAGQGAPPTAPVIAKRFGNLNVVVDKLLLMRDGSYSVNLTFQNKSESIHIGVAMFHAAAYMRPCPLLTTLTAGDGAQFDSDESGLVGINSTRFSPLPLTDIEPNGEIKASIRFGARSRVSETVTSFTLQSEILVNQRYSAHTYDNYRIDQNNLPPGCKVENMVLEIPAPK